MDNAENPNNLKIQIIQNAVWFKTAAHHLLILIDIAHNYKLSSSGTIWLFHEFRATLVWTFMPILLLYSFIYPIVTCRFSLLLPAITIYLVFVFVNYILNLLVVNFKRFKVYIKDYFSTCLSILFTGLGPLYSLFLKEKVKTER